MNGRFLKNVENRLIKSGRDNSILITKIYQFTVIYFNFIWCWGSVVMLTHLKLTASAQNIYREVYVCSRSEWTLASRE